MRSAASGVSSADAESAPADPSARQARKLVKMADKIHKHILATVKPVVTRQTDGGRMWGDEDDPRPDDFGQMLVNASALIEGGSRVYTVVAAKLAELADEAQAQPAGGGGGGGGMAATAAHRRRTGDDAATRVRTLIFQAAALEREVRRVAAADEAALLAERLERAAKPRRASSIVGMEAASAAAAVASEAAASAASAASIAAASQRSADTASTSRKLSCKSAASTATSATELLTWARDLDLEPSVLRSLERALRRGEQRRGRLRSSLAGEDKSSARSGSGTGRSSGSGSDEGGGGRKRLVGRCARAGGACLDAVYDFAMRFEWLYVRYLPVIRRRHVLCVYATALLLAPVIIFLPSVALGLTNDDYERWARCAWQAALVDAVAVQPCLVAVRQKIGCRAM